MRRWIIVLAAVTLVAAAIAVWLVWWPRHTPPAAVEPVFRVHAQPRIAVEPETPEFDAAIRTALSRSQYAVLDRMAVDFNRPDAKFTAGISKLEVFYGILTLYARTMTADGPVAATLAAPGFDMTRILLEKWHRADPGSDSASIALAKLWELRAWDARQHGFTDSVTPERWQQIDERLSNAESYLIDPDPAKDPVVLYEEAQIGALRSYGHARMDDLYRRAVAQFPWYYPYYAQHAIFLLPTWFGDDNEARDYLESVRSPARGDEGKVEYSFAAFRMMEHGEYDEMYDFMALDFAQVIEAYQIREALYGLRLRDWHAIFRLSIPKHDFETMYTALRQFGEHWDSEVWWGDRSKFDETITWFHQRSRYGIGE